MFHSERKSQNEFSLTWPRTTYNISKSLLGKSQNPLGVNLQKKLMKKTNL